MIRGRDIDLMECRSAQSKLLDRMLQEIKVRYLYLTTFKVNLCTDV